MSFEARENCLLCGAHNCITVESRTTKDSRRRRKECQTCKRRHTVHEVNERFFEEAIENRRLIKYITEKLKIQTVLPSDLTKNNSHFTCDSCVHMMSSGCSFGFPEAGGNFATECSTYEAVT